jgi:hypothetical protein
MLLIQPSVRMGGGPATKVAVGMGVADGIGVSVEVDVTVAVGVAVGVPVWVGVFVRVGRVVRVALGEEVPVSSAAVAGLQALRRTASNSRRTENVRLGLVLAVRAMFGCKRDTSWVFVSM